MLMVIQEGFNMAFNPNFNPNGRGRVAVSYGSRPTVKCDSSATMREIPCGTKQAFNALFGDLPEGFIIADITPKRVILKRA